MCTNRLVLICLLFHSANAAGLGLTVEWCVGLFCGIVTLLAITIGCYRSLYQRTVLERAVLDKRSCFSSSNRHLPNNEPDKRPSDIEMVINVHPQPPDTARLVKRTPTPSRESLNLPPDDGKYEKRTPSPSREHYSNGNPESVRSVKRDSASSARKSANRKRKLNEDIPMKVINVLQSNDQTQSGALVPQRIPSFLLQDHSRNVRRVRRRLSDSTGKKDDRSPVVLEIQMLQRDPTDSTHTSNSRPRSVANSLSSRGSLLKTVLQQQSSRRGSPKAQYSHSSVESAASGYPLNKDQMIGPNLFPLDSLDDNASGYPEIKKEITLRPHYADGKKYTLRKKDLRLSILQKISDPTSPGKLLIKIKDEDDMKLQEVLKDRSSDPSSRDGSKGGSMRRKTRKSGRDQIPYKPYNSLSESGMTSRHPSYGSQPSFRNDNLRIVDRTRNKRTLSSTTSVTSSKSKLATMSEFSHYFDDSRASFGAFRGGYNSSLETPQTVISVGTPQQIMNFVPSEKGYLKSLKEAKITDVSSEYTPSETSPDILIEEDYRSFQKVEKVLSEQSILKSPNVFSESPEREPPPPPNWTDSKRSDCKADGIRKVKLDDSRIDQDGTKFTQKRQCSFASSTSGTGDMSPPTPPFKKIRELQLKLINLLAESSDDAIEFPSTPSVSEIFEDSFNSDDCSIKQTIECEMSVNTTNSESVQRAPPPFLMQARSVSMMHGLSEDVESSVEGKQFLQFRSRESEIPEDVLAKYKAFEYLGKTRSTSKPRKDPLRTHFEDIDAEAEDDISLSRSLQRSDTNSSRTKNYKPLRALFEDLDAGRRDTFHGDKTPVNQLEAAEFRKEFGNQLSTIKSRLNYARQLSSQRNDRWKWIKKQTETFVSIFGDTDSQERASPEKNIAQKSEDNSPTFSSTKGHVFV